MADLEKELMMDTSVSVQTAGLSVEIPTARGTLHAVRGVTLTVRKGQTLGIVGESGSGKSLTVSSLANILPETAQASWDEMKVAGTLLQSQEDASWRKVRRDHIGFVFQNPATALNPLLTVGKQVMEAITNKRKRSTKDRYEHAIHLLRSVGIKDAEEKMKAHPHELSGGIAQRVVIAIALACDPDVLIADEPTTALDVSVQAQVLALLKDLSREFELATVLVSHDLHVIYDSTDWVAVMYGGRIVEEGPTQQVLTAPRHPYTRALIEATPRSIGASREHLTSIPGRPPVIIGELPGCSFADRCVRATSFCRENDPELQPTDPGRSVACFFPVSGEVPIPTGDIASRSGADEALVPPTDRALVYEVKNVSKKFFKRGGTLAVRDVSLRVYEGDSFGIIGESGSGKTTLARMLVGLEHPTSGQILYRGVDLRKMTHRELDDMRRGVKFVFQDNTSALDPRLTIGESVLQGLHQVKGLSKSERQERMYRVLNEVGLDSEIAERRPYMLSGGQRQRVGFARALISDPDVIIADEPVSALDVSVQATVLNMINEIKEHRNLTFIMITHDLRVVDYVCDTIVTFRDGEIVEHGSREEVLLNPKSEYTKSLLDAIPGHTEPLHPPTERREAAHGN